MPSKSLLSIAVFLVSLVFGGLLIINGVAVEISWLRFWGPSITFVMFLLSAFDLFFWKFFPESVIKRPKIYGTWRGTIRSNWTNPETGEQIEPIECYATIHQTFSTVSYRQMTEESTSDLVAKEIILSSANVFQLVGVYFNESRILIRDTGRNPIHYGGIRMNIIGSPATRLTGEYWTSRNTVGELNLIQRRKKIFHDFQSAKKVFILGSDKVRD